jgi:poly(A) polymerase
MELLNLLALPSPSVTVARMHALGVLQVVLPEAGRQEVAALDALILTETASTVAPDALRRLAALLPALPPVAEAVAARLRLSGKQRQHLAHVAARTPGDADNPRALAYREGVACAMDRLLLGGGDIAPLIGWKVPQLPLKGGEIVARGVTAGPRVAQTLRAVEARWVAEGFPDTSRVQAILDNELTAGEAST